MALLRDGLAAHQFIVAERVVNNVEPSHPDARLPEADIAFGQPDPGQMIQLHKLKWIQLSSAGYARYDRADLRDALIRRGSILTNSSSVYCEPTAQHALALMLSAMRQLHAAMENQRGAHAWMSAALRGRSQVLEDQTVLLLGFGSIGRRLAELLSSFKLNLIALRRRPAGDEPIRVESIEKLDELLPQADHVVSVLPGGEQTLRMMNAARFSFMKRTAVFFNVGRGTTVDQAALRAALTSGQIAAAYLDVMDPEPLPADDPLWTTPNCYLTPHSAGGAADEFDRVVRHFLANLERYVGCVGLRDRVY
ncbi:MAG TPA: D-2-hydroxyacid dehydrogenase [Tepidisphaeraceae bacterium]|nr:D-2-hydroxyacid dehydrogenase [Tepidisphaeraceae bacterium]